MPNKTTPQQLEELNKDTLESEEEFNKILRTPLTRTQLREALGIPLRTQLSEALSTPLRTQLSEALSTPLRTQLSEALSTPLARTQPGEALIIPLTRTQLSKAYDKCKKQKRANIHSFLMEYFFTEKEYKELSTEQLKIIIDEFVNHEDSKKENEKPFTQDFIDKMYSKYEEQDLRVGKMPSINTNDALNMTTSSQYLRVEGIDHQDIEIKVLSIKEVNNVSSKKEKEKTNTNTNTNTEQVKETNNR